MVVHCPLPKWQLKNYYRGEQNLGDESRKMIFREQVLSLAAKTPWFHTGVLGLSVGSIHSLLLVSTQEAAVDSSSN